ncbi:PREDICTED: protein YLS9-like [Nelumbo nucifera]|uniref:Protein YLS9-like n=2 Tax=Nelumbo nucifera TaxID=4432 RepID=A0A1U8AC60_NELNU|nr:PREDICTED: protein YLS9-like [Nelumbo nucifera]DAD28929.1 TPA_asm: hypothetical protein HUJ06_030397 [Nelumbo nucifera]
MAPADDNQIKHSKGYLQLYPISSNGYPYAAPPSASYYNPQPQPYHPPSHDNCCISCLRCSFILLCSVVFAMLLFSYITWLVFQPELPEFRIDSFSVPTFKISNLELTAKWEVAMSANNPNKNMALMYDGLNTGLMYGSSILTSVLLTPFYLEKMNHTALQAKMVVYSENMKGFLVEKMAMDRSRGFMNFNLKMTAMATFMAGSWMSKTRAVTVYCENLNVEFSATTGMGTLMGGPRHCLVHL